MSRFLGQWENQFQRFVNSFSTIYHAFNYFIHVVFAAFAFVVAACSCYPPSLISVGFTVDIAVVLNMNMKKMNLR